MLMKVLTMRLRVKLGRFDEEASSIEVWVGLAKGDRGEKSGVVDDVPTVGLM